MNSDSYKITRPGLIIIGFITGVLFLATLYLLRLNGAKPSELIVVSLMLLVGIAVLCGAVYVGVKIGRRVYERNKALLEGQEKSFKGIVNFGMCGMILGMFLLGENPMGLIWVIAGVGVVFRKKWGRPLFIVAAVTSALLLVLDVFSGETIEKVQQIASRGHLNVYYAMVIFTFLRVLLLGFYIAGILYFTRQRVKDLFK